MKAVKLSERVNNMMKEDKEDVKNFRSERHSTDQISFENVTEENKNSF